MASLFKDLSGNIKVLEPGCGIGSLVASFVDEALRRKKVKSLDLTLYDIEPIIQPFLSETIQRCNQVADAAGVAFSSNFQLTDFILATARNGKNDLFCSSEPLFTHVIINPPYK